MGPALAPQSTTASEPQAGGIRALSWNAFLSIYAPAMILALGTGIALPAIPVLAKSFDVSFGLASFVVTAFLLGGLAGSLPTGWLIDRFGRRPIMIGGPLLTAVMAFLMMAAQSFPELLVYRFLGGWAAQMWLLGRLAGIAQRAPVTQRARQVSWMYGMDNVGMLSGPLVGGFIAAWWGPRGPFAAYGILALVALVPTIWLVESGPPSRPPASGPAGEPDRGRMSVAAIVLPRLAFFAVAFLSAVARAPIFAGMLHLYAAFAYDLDATAIGILASTASIVSMPIGFTNGWMMDRFGRKATMVPGFFGVTIAMLCLAATAFLHLSLVWYVVVFLGTVAAQAFTGSSTQTIGTDIAPPNARGMFLGLWRFTGQVGTSLSPVVFAFLADRAGYGSAFIFIAASALTVALLLVTRVPETSRVSETSPGGDSAGASRGRG